MKTHIQTETLATLSQLITGNTENTTVTNITDKIEQIAESKKAKIKAAVPITQKKSLDLTGLVYYDASSKEYLYKNERKIWRAYGDAAIKRILKFLGFRASIPKDENGTPTDKLSDVDYALIELQDKHDVDYHGKLCGRSAGFYDENGTRFLVTNSPQLIEPVYGQWPIFNAFLSGLIRDNEPEYGETQWNTLHGWMQTAVIALRSGKIQQAQALAIAGKPNCGKSLLQQIITHILGGRAAKAAHFMNGRTDFNGELFEAEHLLLEDEFMSTRIHDRLQLGAAIKGMTVSTSLVSCQRKHRHPVNLPAWWRVSISLNDDPEALLVLPPLDEHIADKIILLRASCFDLPMPTDNTELKDKFWQTLIAEIPHYLHWLINEFVIPDEYSDKKRYVVATWHHPEMKQALERLSPESELLNLIVRALWRTEREEEWKGTADELRTLLLDDSRTKRDAERLIGGWAQACGTYLGRLAKKHPEYVKEARTANKREWIIYPELINGKI
ncbi:hypothetical protein BH11VER1_BH11VER1_22950 [soil metagenome]